MQRRSMASFLLSEVFILEKVIASGHADLEDLTCEATVCTDVHQAYCEAIKNMISCALDKNCDGAEEESLRQELIKTMRRRGITAEKRYKRLRDVIIDASRSFSAEKTYYNVKRTAILPAAVVDEDKMVTDALQLLGAESSLETGKASSSAAASKGSSSRKSTTRNPSLKGCGRVLPSLPENEEGLSRMMKRARSDNDFHLYQ